MKIPVKILSPGAILPTAGSRYAAGYDLRACLDVPVEIPPHETGWIGTGLAVAVPEGYFGAVFARSGLASKQGLRPANCVGLCDSDYRGEYIIALHNDSAETRTVSPGDRIAQLVILPYAACVPVEAEELSESGRGTGGFGSTGR